MSEARTEPTPHLELSAGGQPSPSELAAIVAAIVAAEGTATVPGPSPDPAGIPPPAWTHAARLEGIGGAIVAAPSDLNASPGTIRRP